ncbi:MAG: hypothetical protein AAGJ29_06880, partial [Pseudomonadota bacterium]
ARTDAPGGFVWKYILSYIGILILLLVAFGLLLGGLLAPLLTASGSDLTGDELALLGVVYLIFIPVSLVMGAVFEASYLRRYLRADTFKLRFGGDELRLIVVYILWFLMVIAFYVLLFGSVLLIGGGGSADFATIGAVAAIFVLLISVAWLYLAIRLAPAAALTIRDRKIRFASAWRLTRGRFWTLFGAYLALIGCAFLAYILVSIIIGIVMIGAVGASGGLEDPAAIEAAFATPVLLIPFGLLYMAVIAAYVWFGYVWAGPAALAARIDPDHGDTTSQADAFS